LTVNNYDCSINLDGNRRCINCVRSNNRHNVDLDESGLCKLCQQYEEDSANREQVTIDWKEFASVLRTRYCNAVSRYQCMVLLSGGKDSVYMLHLLSQIPDFRILAVTIDHWFNSPESESNIRRVLKRIPVDHINFRPSWGIIRELYKELIVKTGKLCLACEAFLTTEIYRFAVEMRIPCMAWGLSRQQFKTPPDWLAEIDITYWNKMEKRFIVSLGQVIGLESELYQRFRKNYVPNIAGEAVSLPDLLFPFLALDYDPLKVELVVQDLGWRRPTDVAGTSSNCHAQYLHTYIKQNTHSPELLEDELAELVRKGVISRQRAMAVLKTRISRDAANRILADIGCEIDVGAIVKHLLNQGEGDSK